MVNLTGSGDPIFPLVDPWTSHGDMLGNTGGLHGVKCVDMIVKGKGIVIDN